MKNILLSILFIFASATVSNLYAVCELKNNQIIVSKLTDCDTIKKGIDFAQPGQTVKVLDGTYEENIVIGKSINVIGDDIKDAKGEIIKRPVIKSLNKEIVNISGTKIIFDGFEIKNADDFVEMLDDERKKGDIEHKAGRVGIKIEPGSSEITISHNKFNYIGYKYQTEWIGEQTHGINAVSYKYKNEDGIEIEKPITCIHIIDNRFTNLHLGKSEALTLNGNLSNFEILKNQFWNIDNIAIDISGYYGKCSQAKDKNYCQANDGQITENKVWNLLSGNPGQLPEPYPTLAGIYVDGGRNVIVDKNEVHDFGVGLDFGSENGKSIDSVILSNNLIYSNKSAGIWIGNDGFTEEIKDCFVLNNTIVNNNTEKKGEGAIRFTQKVGIKNLAVANNIFLSDFEYPLITNLQNKKAKKSLIFLNNFFYSANRENFSNNAPENFADFLKKYGSTAGRFEKVEFAENYDLKKDSSTVDQGTSNYLGKMCKDLSKCYDLRVNPRIFNNKIDVGAVEFQFSK